jgi:hypothetical protein
MEDYLNALKAAGAGEINPEKDAREFENRQKTRYRIGFTRNGSTFYFMGENGFIQTVDMEDMEFNMQIWLEEAQHGLMVFDALGDVINLGIDWKKGDTLAAVLDGFSIFLYGSIRSMKVLKGIPSPKVLNPPINITKEGMNHVFNFHINPSIPGKSKWALNIDVVHLIQEATQHPIVKQEKGNYARIVDAGVNIGIDRKGKATSYYTVITTSSGDLVNAFPGLPSSNIRSRSCLSLLL